MAVYGSHLLEKKARTDEMTKAVEKAHRKCKSKKAFLPTPFPTYDVFGGSQW